MAHKVGAPKTGGRKPGTPNVDTAALCKALRDAGYDLVAEAMRVAAAAWEQYDRVRCLQEDSRLGMNDSQAAEYLKIAQKSVQDLFQYVYPKRKAIELTGAEGKDLFDAFGLMIKEASDRFEKKATFLIEPNPNVDHADS